MDVNKPILLLKALGTTSGGPRDLPLRNRKVPNRRSRPPHQTGPSPLEPTVAAPQMHPRSCRGRIVCSRSAPTPNWLKSLSPTISPSLIHLVWSLWGLPSRSEHSGMEKRSAQRALPMRSTIPHPRIRFGRRLFPEIGHDRRRPGGYTQKGGKPWRGLLLVAFVWSIYHACACPPHAELLCQRHQELFTAFSTSESWFLRTVGSLPCTPPGPAPVMSHQWSFGPLEAFWLQESLRVSHLVYTLRLTNMEVEHGLFLCE